MMVEQFVLLTRVNIQLLTVLLLKIMQLVGVEQSVHLLKTHSFIILHSKTILQQTVEQLFGEILLTMILFIIVFSLEITQQIMVEQSNGKVQTVQFIIPHSKTILQQTVLQSNGKVQTVQFIIPHSKTILQQTVVQSTGKEMMVLFTIRPLVKIVQILMVEQSSGVEQMEQFIIPHSKTILEFHKVEQYSQII